MMFKFRSVYFTAALSAVLTVAAVASAKYKAQNSSIEVDAKGPGGLAIQGKSSVLKIKEDDQNVTFLTYLNTIDTGISKRNEHMQERFHAKEHPEVTLTVAKGKIDDKKGGTVPGTLNLNGKDHAVTVTYSVDGKHVKAHFPVSVTNHEIKKEELCMMGVCASPDVTIKVEFDLKD